MDNGIPQEILVILTCLLPMLAGLFIGSLLANFPRTRGWNKFLRDRITMISTITVWGVFVLLLYLIQIRFFDNPSSNKQPFDLS
jgi:hypothetical protein